MRSTPERGHTFPRWRQASQCDQQVLSRALNFTTNVIPLGQGYVGSCGKNLRLRVRGHVPAHSPGGTPHPTRGLFPRPGELLLLGRQVVENASVLAENPHGSPDLRDVQQRPGGLLRPRSECAGCRGSEMPGTSLPDRNAPGLPPSFRKCSQLNPRGSHAQKRTGPGPASVRPPCTQPLSPQQLFTSRSPLPLSDPPSVFTPSVGTSARVRVRRLPDPSRPPALSGGEGAAEGWAGPGCWRWWVRFPTLSLPP